MIQQPEYYDKEVLKTFVRNNGIYPLSSKVSNVLLGGNPFDDLLELDRQGILGFLIPEMNNLKGVENHNGYIYKDIFLHTLGVVAKLANNDVKDLNLYWAALLHDIGKPATRRFVNNKGWTFHTHELIGATMAGEILNRLELQNDVNIPKVQNLIKLHTRCGMLANDEDVTESGIRRLISDAGEDLDDLIELSRVDCTSNHIEKVNLINTNLLHLKAKSSLIKKKDELRSFKNPINGNYIMEVYKIEPNNIITQIKDAIRDAILTGHIENTFEAADTFMRWYVENEFGMKPAN